MKIRKKQIRKAYDLYEGKKNYLKAVFYESRKQWKRFEAMLRR